MSGHLDYEINKELGECYLFMGELDKAEDYYKKAISSNGIHPDPFIGLATIAVQRGELDSALALYRKAHNIEATDKSFSGMALIDMEQGKGNAAFDGFLHALEINPQNMVALFSLVRLGHELERLAEVLPHLVNYLALDAGKHEVRYALAGCYVCLDMANEAVEQLDIILASNPAHEPARELLAHIRS